MSNSYKWLANAAVGLGLMFAPVAVTRAAPADGYQYGGRSDRGYGDLRGLVDRTQSDLRQAAGMQREKGDQMKRFDQAQQHLSDFDRKLTKGKFDKGRLDSAISSIKSILDKNTLQASSRDMLMRDLSDLHAVRDHRY